MANPTIIALHAFVSLSTIASNTTLARSINPHFAYISINEVLSSRSTVIPFLSI
uniref:Uncharacterized protein n=1 Tax=Arundo donax TaxID=35708 RepID=A0A0A9AGY2_ARUDO